MMHRCATSGPIPAVRGGHRTGTLASARRSWEQGLMFSLHPRLAADTTLVSDLPLCAVRLMKDARVPWLILVPRRADIRELHHLGTADRVQLMEEIAQASGVLEALYHPDKLNVGALGNLVPQLHVHVLGRYRVDPAWPGPIWGSGPAIAYADTRLTEELLRLRAAFGA